MSNPTNALEFGKFHRHRIATGAPVAADGAVSGTFPNRKSLLNAAGWDSIVYKVSIAGGGTATLEFLAYDEEADTFGILATTAALSDGAIGVLDVYGLRVFARIKTIGANPTSVEIRVAPGRASGQN